VCAWEYLRTTRITVPPIPWFNGCYIEQRDRGLVLQSTYVLLLSFELVVIILTVRRGYKDFPSGTSLLKVLYRDSVAFFIVLFVLTLSALPIHMSAPPQYNGIMSPVVRAVHSVLCCRILLNIKQAASKAYILPSERPTSIEFATPPRQGTNQAETIRLEVYDRPSTEEDFFRHEDRDFVV